MDTILHPVRKPNNSQFSQWDDDTQDADGVENENFKPLTRKEAQQWRSEQAEVSVWRVLMWQAVLALVMTALAALLALDSVVVKSVLYGAASVVLPSALMAWGVTSSALARLTSGAAKASLLNFFVWEGIKLVLVVALMVSAPVVLGAVSWLALVVGLVVVLKVYGLVFYFQSKRRR